jgi:hypothetical protein
VLPRALLDYLAQQLDVDVGAFAAYVRRDQTRRAHLAELSHRLGLLAFGRVAFRAMIDWALPLAASIRDPEAMATLLVEDCGAATLSSAFSRRPELNFCLAEHEVMPSAISTCGIAAVTGDLLSPILEERRTSSPSNLPTWT